jgi:hypothetical protein
MNRIPPGARFDDYLAAQQSLRRVTLRVLPLALAFWLCLLALGAMLLEICSRSGCPR